MKGTNRDRGTVRCWVRVRTIFVLALIVQLCIPLAHGQPTKRDIVLMLDNSGSMRKNDPDFLTSVAVRAFIEGLDDDDHVAIVSFDQNVKVLQRLAALSAPHRNALLSSLNSINYRGLLTNSPAALERSIYELRTNGRPGAEKSIIFMTDGIVDVGPDGADLGDVDKARWMKSTLADEAVEHSVRIFGIAFTDNADYELIQTLSKRTGGEHYRAYNAPDIDGVFSSIRSRLTSPQPAVATATSPSSVNTYIPPATSTADTATAGETASTDEQTPSAADESSADAAQPDRSNDQISTSANANPVSQDEASTNADSTADSTTPSPTEVALADGELPKVNLPVVNLGTDSAPTADPGSQQVAKQQAANTTTVPSTTPVSPTDASSESAAAETTATPTSGSEPNSSASSPLPEAMDDSKFYLALTIGAAAILLALAALVFVLMRRRPAATALNDALMPQAFLNDIADSTEQPSYEIGATPVIVGRLQGPDSDGVEYIVIDETTIGRRHALIEYKEHSFWVTDQNSLNGTFVNNERLETGVRLKHGDRIRFHKHEFEFQVLDMFESDRTMMSETVFADSSPRDAEDDATIVRIDDNGDVRTSGKS